MQFGQLDDFPQDLPFTKTQTGQCRFPPILRVLRTPFVQVPHRMP